MASTYLTRTPSSSGNRKTWTWSSWCKFSQNTNIDTLLSVGADSNNRTKIIRNNVQNGDIRFLYSVGGVQYDLVTSALYRDVSAWYHIVVAVDTTQSTSSNRVKIYINGEQISVFDTANYLPQNTDTDINTTNAHYIGRYSYSASNYMDGSMSHIHFIDGTAYDASAFGETDSTTGEWKIKTSPSVSYGTNGFFILKDGNSVTDQSGNGNNFTVGGGTLTKTEDNPSNVFATLNPLDVTADDEGTYSNGNTTASGDGSFHQFRSTFYLTTGKYYWEFKPTTVGNAMEGGVVGSNYAGGSGLRRHYNANGYKYEDGSSASYGATYTTNDIIGVALNLDDGELTFYKNGVSQGVAFTNMLSTIGQDGWTPSFVLYNSTVNVNYGNGYFGTTAVSSNSGNGYSASENLGIFQHQPPTNYTALCTKGLNL
jgi:hypothetical protein